MMYNPYKKEYKNTSKNISNRNTIMIKMNSNKTYNTYKTNNSFKCKKCKIICKNQITLDKHLHIHINPVYCHFPNCGRLFSPKHTYQYRQHIDSHNGGLHIKCKFCDHSSKTLSSNTAHMKLHHKEEYTLYKKHINEYNEDLKKIDTIHITKLLYLASKYIKTSYTEEEDDSGLTYIDHNKYYYNDIDDNEKNNLDLFADIALSYSYVKY